MVDAFRYEAWTDNEITVVVLSDGALRISVTNEQAVDSYNSTFENYIDVPVAEARKLRNWLIANLSD